jgi:hypothetical protein
MIIPDGALNCRPHNCRVLIEKAKEGMIDDNFKRGIGRNRAHRLKHVDLLDGIGYARALHKEARGEHSRLVRIEDDVRANLGVLRFHHELVQIFVELFSCFYPKNKQACLPVGVLKDHSTKNLLHQISW